MMPEEFEVLTAAELAAEEAAIGVANTGHKIQRHRSPFVEIERLVAPGRSMERRMLTLHVSRIASFKPSEDGTCVISLFRRRAVGCHDTA
jgi:hypothetical protein